MITPTNKMTIRTTKRLTSRGYLDEIQSTPKIALLLRQRRKIFAGATACLMLMLLAPAEVAGKRRLPSNDSYVKKHRVGTHTLKFGRNLRPDTLYRVWFVTDRVARYKKLYKFSDILKHDSEETKGTKQTRQVMTLTQVELIRLKAGYSILLLTIRPEETLECRYAMMRIDDMADSDAGKFSKTEKAIHDCLAKLRFIPVELRIWTRDNKLFRKVLKHSEFTQNDLTVRHIKGGRTDWYRKEQVALGSKYIRRNKLANANSYKAHYISRHIRNKGFKNKNDFAFVLWKMVYPKGSYDRYTCDNKVCKAFELPITTGTVCKECKKEGDAPRDTYHRLLKQPQLTDDKLRASPNFTPNLEENLRGVRRDKKGASYRTKKVDRGINHSGHGHQIPAWEVEEMVKDFFGEKHMTKLDTLGLYK